MLHRKPILILFLGLVCAIGTSATAGAQPVHDLCIELSGSAGYAVFRSPKIQLNCCPLNASEINNCVPLNGFESGSPTGGMFTGTGCVDSLGNSFIYHYVYHNQYALTHWFVGYFETGVCRFPLGKNEGSLGGHKGILGDCRGTFTSTPPGSTTATSGSFPAQAVLWFCNGENVLDGIQPQ
jgi:hypothetical protein